MSIYSLKERRLQKSLNELSRTCSVLKKRLSGLLKNSVRAMLAALEVRDAYTHGHVVRGSLYALMLGRALKLPREKLIQLELGALLHDIGKIGVKEEVLHKPGPLTEPELEHVREHPVRGYEICCHLKSLSPTLTVIRHHHERHDGHGYPDKLGGNQVTLPARIASIVDSFDAMTTNRPYRKGVKPGDAIEIFIKEKDYGQWDPELVTEFVKLMKIQLRL